METGRKVLATSSITFHGITDTLRSEDEKYAQALSTAADAFREAEALFDSPDFLTRNGWEKETETDDGDGVYSRHTDNGKMVAVSTTLDCNVDTAMNATWTGIDSVPTWDPNIDYASRIVSLTDNADIVTYGNNDVLIVSGRDLVTARIFRPLPNGGYRMAFRSVTVDEKPERKGIVRAHLYLGAVQFRPHPDDSEKKTIYDVITLVDLKGMFPRILLNQIVGKIMVMDAQIKVKHFKELAKETP